MNVTFDLDLNGNLEEAPFDTPLVVLVERGLIEAATRKSQPAIARAAWPPKGAIAWSKVPESAWRLAFRAHLPEWAIDHVTIDGWRSLSVTAIHRDTKVGAMHVCFPTAYEDLAVLDWYYDDECEPRRVIMPSVQEAIRTVEKIVKVMSVFEPEVKP